MNLFLINNLILYNIASFDVNWNWKWISVYLIQYFAIPLWIIRGSPEYRVAILENPAPSHQLA